MKNNQNLIECQTMTTVIKNVLFFSAIPAIMNFTDIVRITMAAKFWISLPDACLTHLRSAHTRGLVPATSPLKSLHEGTGRRDLFHKKFTRSVLCNKLQGLVPKIQTGLNSWDKSQRLKLVPATRF